MNEIESKARALFLGTLDGWIANLERDKTKMLREDRLTEAKWYQYLIDLIITERDKGL